MYIIKWSADVCWVGDGVGAMNVPGSQTKRLNNDFGANGGFVQVPGGDTPTGANLTTAAATVGTNLGNALNVAATLAQIQAFATGGP